MNHLKALSSTTIVGIVDVICILVSVIINYYLQTKIIY